MRKKKKDSQVSFEEKREFFRHPICLPLEFKKVKNSKAAKAKTKNISLGGLLFLSRLKVEKESRIKVALPFKDRVFHLDGHVVRCEKEHDSTLYQVGVKFFKVSDAFKAKLVEQLHLIEEYRNLLTIHESREVSLEEASQEWIDKYAEMFQKQYW